MKTQPKTQTDKNVSTFIKIHHLIGHAAAYRDQQVLNQAGKLIKDVEKMITEYSTPQEVSMLKTIKGTYGMTVEYLRLEMSLRENG